jgi:hypothetical protein
VNTTPTECEGNVSPTVAIAGLGRSVSSTILSTFNGFSEVPLPLPYLAGHVGRRQFADQRFRHPVGVIPTRGQETQDSPAPSFS